MILDSEIAMASKSIFLDWIKASLNHQSSLKESMYLSVEERDSRYMLLIFLIDWYHIIYS